MTRKCNLHFLKQNKQKIQTNKSQTEKRSGVLLNFLRISTTLHKFLPCLLKHRKRPLWPTDIGVLWLRMYRVKYDTLQWYQSFFTSSLKLTSLTSIHFSFSLTLKLKYEENVGKEQHPLYNTYIPFKALDIYTILLEKVTTLIFINHYSTNSIQL